MRTHTNNFKTEIKEFGREFDDKLYYTSNGTTTTYTQENINSVNYFVDTSLLKSVMQTLTIDSDLDLEVDNTIDYGCILANDEIRYNNFIIVKKEEQKDTNSYLYTCYDNMIKAMKEYNTFLNATSDVTFTDNKNYYELDNNIYTLYTGDRTGNPTSLGLYESSFPMTIRNYLNVICTRLGITFDNTQTFTNYDKNVLSEHYVDVELNSLGYTYRDVLDDIAEATGSFICIDNNGQLEVRSITNAISSKNLLGYKSRPTSQNVTTTYDETDGALILNGQCDRTWADLTGESLISWGAGTYTFSTPTAKNYSVTLRIVYQDNSYSNISIPFGSTEATFTISKATKNQRLYIYGNNLFPGINFQNERLYLQVEKNSEATEYEPYVDTINEEYFSDDNVNIGEKYGPINVVVLSRGSGADNLVRPTTTPQNPTEIKIEYNPILEQTNREDYIDGIYNNLNGLEFYLNDLNSTGVMYYEVGDKYNIKIDDTYYPCLLLSDNITRDDGLDEKIYTNEPTTSVSDYKYASNTDKIEKQSRNAYFLADKANGVAEMIVEGIGSNGQVTGASVIASINGDTSSLTLNADKINLNGAVTANNNFHIKNDGSVEINDGELALKDTGTGWQSSSRLTITSLDETKLAYLTSNKFDLKETYTYGSDTYEQDTFISSGQVAVINYKNDDEEIKSAKLWTDNIELLHIIGDTREYTNIFPNFFQSGKSVNGNATTNYTLSANGIEIYVPTYIDEVLEVNKYTKPLTVESIKTKNLLEFANRTNTTNNITTTTYNGIISISGTFSTQTSFTFNITPVTLKAGKTYTFAKNQSNDGHYPYLFLRDANSTNIIGTDYQNSVVSYTPTSDVTITQLGFYINGKDAIGSTIYPQLEEGSVATDWCEHKNLTYSSGQHSNGNYIKYDDGTLIQWGVIAKSNYLNSSTTSTSVQGINWYRSKIYALYFPYEFIDENYSLTLSAQCGTNGSRFIMTDTLTKRVRYFESQLIGVENFTSSGTGYTNLTNVSWIAIGRWK